jgi:hypothetical protein
LALNEEEEILPLTDEPQDERGVHKEQVTGCQKKQAWRTDVPWLQKLVPASHTLPENILYCQILRQPSKSAYIGYYKHAKGTHAPHEYRTESKTAKFGQMQGRQVTEHMAAAIALEWIWLKHMQFVHAEFPEEVDKFLAECKACAEGNCQVLEVLQNNWPTHKADNGLEYGFDSASSSDESSSSSDVSVARSQTTATARSNPERL